MDNKVFKTVCLVFSAAFSAASCVWPWTAPIGAGLGLYANIDTKDRPKLEEEFVAAVDAALNKTRDNLTTVDSQEIIDELSSDIVRPDNLDDLISKTETYRRQYCTVLDRKRIVDTFEMYFKEEVCRCDTLSNYYLLAAGTVTLETIKSVSNALIKQDEKLSAIEHTVNEIYYKETKILNLFRSLLSECGFVLIAVAGCLFIGLAIEVSAPFFYIHVTICYLLSSPITASILKMTRSKITHSLNPHSMSSFSNVFSVMVLLLIYAIIPVGIYFILISSQPLASQSFEQTNKVTENEVLCVFAGGALSYFFRAMYQFELFEHDKITSDNASKD